MSKPVQLPNGVDAEVPRGKLVGYLLSAAHPIGSAKARYFTSRGYRVADADVLQRDLKEIARTGSVHSTQDGKWGTKYVVTGAVQAPDGDQMALSTVWIVSEGAHPLFVTAYPWRGRTV